MIKKKSKKNREAINENNKANSKKENKKKIMIDKNESKIIFLICFK